MTDCILQDEVTVFFWMKQSKAGTGNLNQDLFFSCSCFWPYTASLTKGQVVMLHSYSELLFNSLYQHQPKIWRPRACPTCLWPSTVWYRVLHCTRTCAEGETWRWCLRRHGPSETGWEKKGTACLASPSMWQLRWTWWCTGRQLP